MQYTVEVCRDGGPLGLTLSGSEDPLSVLSVAALTPGIDFAIIFMHKKIEMNSY